MTRILLFILFQFTSLANQSDASALQCALTYRLMHFADLEKKSGPYRICVLGDEKVYKILRDKVSGSKIGKNTINVKLLKTSKFGNCDVIFIGKNVNNKEKSDLSIYTKVNKALVVTSQIKNRPYSYITFREKDGSVVFDANKTLMDTTNFEMSSKILRLANEVF